MTTPSLLDRFQERLRFLLAPPGFPWIGNYEPARDYVIKNHERIANRLAAAMAAEVEHLAGILERNTNVRAAMLSRREEYDQLIMGWPFPWWTDDETVPNHLNLRPVLWEGDPDAPDLRTRLNVETGLVEKMPLWIWPPKAAAADVGDWLGRSRHRTAQLIAERLIAGQYSGPDGLGPRERGYLETETRDDPRTSYFRRYVDTVGGIHPYTSHFPPWVEDADGHRWPVSGVALLFLAWRDVETRRRGRFIAVDAGKPHHSLLAELATVAKEGADIDYDPSECRYELTLPGRPSQLILPDAHFGEALTEKIQAWAGKEGLKNWAGFLSVMTNEGHRQRWAEWTIDAQLEALGYAASKRRNPAVRIRTAEIVETFTKVQWEMVAPDGRRVGRPLVLIGESHFAPVTKGGEPTGKEFLASAKMVPNPLFWDGVRRSETGKLGRNWCPTSEDIAKIDHERFFPALAMGLILPIRFRLHITKDVDHLRLAGRSLLALARIPYTSAHPARAWERLDRNIAELKRRGGIGWIEWEGNGPGLDTICRVYPPARVADALVQRLRPVERRPPPKIKTGKDLQAWRKGHGWTVAELAARIGVGVATIKRAEAAKDAEIPRGSVLATAIRQRG